MSSDNKVVIGFTSKLASVICNYPLLSVLGLFGVIFTLALASGEDIAAIGRGSAVVIAIFGTMRFLAHLFMKKWCYKVEINKKANRITGHFFFNKGPIDILISNPQVKIGSYCYIRNDSQEFIIPVAFIHKLVSHLPLNTRIVYVGHIGKYKEKEWNRTGRPLVPGVAT